MKKLCDFCIYSIKTIALAISCLLLVLVFTNRAFQTQGKDGVIQIFRQPIWYYILLLVSIVCILAVRKLLDKVSPNVLFVVFAAIYLLMGLYLILNVTPDIRSDQRDVFDAALQFNQGNWEQFRTGRELFRNPHNIGIATFYSLLTSINQSTKFAFAINLIFIILTNLFLYRTAVLCFKNRAAAAYTVLFSFAFLPQFFYTLFIYGNVPGFCFVTAMIFFAAKMFKEEHTAVINKTVYGILAVVCGATAVLMRNNYIIAVIAVVIICAIKFMKDKKAVNIILAALLMLSVIIAPDMLKGHYERKIGYELDGIPMNLYIAMGLQEAEKGPGWYNGFNHHTFEENGFDTEKSAEAGMEAIKERISYFADNPQYAFAFFRDKVITTWCEPTCQSIYSGPVESKGQIVENPILKNLYGGGKLYEIVYLFCNIIITDILLFSIICQIAAFKEKEFSLWMLCILLFFVGGFLFHIMWETKSRYICIYYAALAPIAANGAKVMTDKLKKVLSDRTV